MDNKNILEKIKELKDLINTKIKEIIEIEKPTIKIGTRYYTPYSDGTINHTNWKNNNFDNDRLTIGNVFSTEQEAKNELTKRKAIQKIKLYITENFPFKPNWNDNKDKWNIYHNHDEDITATYFADIIEITKTQNQTQIGFLKSKENAETIIKLFKKELDIIFEINN